MDESPLPLNTSAGAERQSQRDCVRFRCRTRSQSFRFVPRGFCLIVCGQFCNYRFLAADKRQTFFYADVPPRFAFGDDFRVVGFRAALRNLFRRVPARVFYLESYRCSACERFVLYALARLGDFGNFTD